MEEVKRVTTKKKANTGTIILVVLAALLGLGLIGAAVYFYAIESPEDRIAKTESTCACYYIDQMCIRDRCNPGLQSIEAVWKPQESSYYFYIHDKEKNPHFADTLDEHRKNIEKYLR